MTHAKLASLVLVLALPLASQAAAGTPATPAGGQDTTSRQIQAPPPTPTPPPVPQPAPAPELPTTPPAHPPPDPTLLDSRQQAQLDAALRVCVELPAEERMQCERDAHDAHDPEE